MILRSKQLWIVAFYLSKFCRPIEGKKIAPPIELGVENWRDAYRMFYESLGGGRTIDAFEHSLKNARDAYDSHMIESTRIGWRDKKGNPSPLDEPAQRIFEKYSSKSQVETWNEIKEWANLKIKDLGKEIEDLIAIQQVEEHQIVKSKTEGGKKVIISFRYERNPTLRNQAFKIHGYDCAICGFSFSKVYGEWGKGFAEVHHIQPFSDSGELKKETNPKTDLIVLCANCHRMIHRKRGITLAVDELKSKMHQSIQRKKSD